MTSGIGRRQFISALGSATLAGPLGVRAQQSDKLLRIGTANAQPRSAPQWVAFENRLHELGYNFSFDYVQVTGSDGWNDGYHEVIARKPDIVIAAGPENSLKAAVAEAGALPIVMIAVDFDPIARHYAASLAKPGGNLTGVYTQNAELVSKHLQLIKQAVPDVSTVTVFRDRQNVDYWTALQAAAPQQNIKLAWFDFDERPYDYERAVASMASSERGFPHCHVVAVLLSRSRKIGGSRASPTRAVADASPGIGGRGNAHVLRRGPSQHVGAGGGPCRFDRQRYQSGRCADRATDQVRSRDQSHNCQDARYHFPADFSRACRRGDRIALSQCDNLRWRCAGLKSGTSF